MTIKISAISCALSLGALAAAASAQTADVAQAAVWTPAKLDFTYFGFTTTYSCDGLHDQIKSALLQFGARKDLVVQETGCVGSTGRPTPFPGVSVKMNVLRPIDPAKAASDAHTAKAHWKTVKLKMDQGIVSPDSGTCELVEQIQQKILPLFTTRNVKFSATCIPHQAASSGPLLQADVLIADDKAAVATRS